MQALAQSLISGERRLIVLDVEATCWKERLFTKKKETIELGAVHWIRTRGPSEWPEFQTFVRPKNQPKLSSFCRELTGIAQADVDAGPLFPEALYRLLDWAGPLEDLVLGSWSPYDLWQLNLDLEVHRLPKLELPHLDLKKLASRRLGAKSFARTAAALGIEIANDRHRALADAKVTALIAHRLLTP